MKTIFSSKFFWFASIIGMFFSLLILININKVYMAETKILVVSKNEKTSRIFPEIISTVKNFPYSLKFYEELISENDQLEDGLFAFSDSKKLKLWLKKIKTEQIEKSGIISILITDESQWQAEELSLSTAKKLAIDMSRYYDIKSDLDIRIVDGPNSSYITSFPVFSIFTISILVGFAIGGIFYLIFSLLVFMSQDEKRKPLVKTNEKISFDKRPGGLLRFEGGFIPEKPILENSQIKIKKNLVIPDFKPKKVDETYSITKKAPAPANLPIASEKESLEEEIPLPENKEIAFSFDKEEEIVNPDEIYSFEDENEKATREATPEEVKARLNKLLNGDF